MTILTKTRKTSFYEFSSFNSNSTQVSSFQSNLPRKHTQVSSFTPKLEHKPTQNFGFKTRIDLSPTQIFCHLRKYLRKYRKNTYNTVSSPSR